MPVDFGFIFKLFLRRLHIFLLVALPVATAGAWLAWSLPPQFQAQARLLVESPQVPAELASSTMRADPSEVLRVIEQRLLTRQNMLDLSRQFGLHAEQPGLSPDAIVADMRRRITLRLPGARAGGGAVVEVSFTAARPDVSAEITNVLVTQILRENVALRTAVATQTLAFFDDEVARLSDELSMMSERLLQFRQANQNALPENLAFLRSRQASLQERLVQNQRQLSSLGDRRERLITVFERTGRVEGAGEALSPEQRQLLELQRELARALVVFSPDNPRIRTLQGQISALEGSIASEAGLEGASSTGSMALDLQLTDIDAQIEFLEDQSAVLERDLAELERAIEATPANTARLESMERDFSNIQTQYNNAVARRAQARIGERIEAQARGHRITVLEQAVPPANPSRPNRRLVAAAGAGGGVFAGVVVVLLLIVLNRAVLRPVEISARMGVAPFAAIPYFRTRREMLMRRGLVGAAVLLIAVGIPGALWWVDQNYLPLDLVMDRIAQRTGIDGLIGALRGPTG